ncbi:hypothetical protein JOM56_009567, partial [Amanita muscaria]
MLPDHAFQLLSDLNLHLGINDVPRDARSKMSIVYSDSGHVGPNKKYMCWTRLYQCLCGTNHEEGHYPSKKRLMPWKNIKCSMYARVVSTHDSSKDKVLAINEIAGILEHSDACQDVIQMDQKPSIPLHPELWEYALSLLRDRIPISRVRILCREWSMSKWGNSPGDVHHCYVLMSYESTSLYRTLRHADGITARSTAIDNLYQWFGGDNPSPPVPELGESCLFYQNVGSGNDERLILILSTTRQRQMAWSYGHQKQMILDGTFGVCSTSVLVFFLMAIDDRNVGIPVATIVFTLKKDAKAGHASYDGPLLARLLEHWKEGMGRNSAGEQFEIKIANTDNDPRERHGLQTVWKDIFLLLCMFHTWQSWRNGLTRYLACIPKGDARKHVRARLGKFLMCQLKDTSDYSDAIAAYNLEMEYFRLLSGNGSTALDRSKSQGGLAFLAYFKSYLALQGFWMSWSRAGVIEAAKILQTTVDKVPRTTNHLESFNGRIKHKYFASYQHSGRLPRLDMWVLLIGTRVTTDFF